MKPKKEREKKEERKIEPGSNEIEGFVSIAIQIFLS